MWPALLSALFFNMHLQLFGPLFTGYMGMGDKETFPLAMVAHQIPYSVVPTPPHTLGTQAHAQCAWGLECGKRVHMNTMVQMNPAGEIVFLHANMQKWLLAVETDFGEYPRRWQAIMPGPDMLVQPWPELSKTLFGCALRRVSSSTAAGLLQGWQADYSALLCTAFGLQQPHAPCTHSVIEQSDLMCRCDLESVVHQMLVSLRCEPAVALATARTEAMLPQHQRGGPLLTNERLHFEAGSADLMHVYMCALFASCEPEYQARLWPRYLWRTRAHCAYLCTARLIERT